MDKPPRVPTDEYIEHLWRSVRAGRITWQEVRDFQAATMPLCTPHGKPANVSIGRVPMCELCVRQRYG